MWGPPHTFCVCGIDIAQSQAGSPLFIPIFASWGILHASKSPHSAWWAHPKRARSAQVCSEFHVNWHPLTSAECIMSHIQVWYLLTVYISEQTWSGDSISALVLDCTISRHQASLSCLCQGARHILLINCDLTLLWLHIIGRHLGTGHGYHGASHIMLAAGPRYILYCRHTLSTRDKQMKTSY